MKKLAVQLQKALIKGKNSISIPPDIEALLNV